MGWESRSNRQYEGAVVSQREREGGGQGEERATGRKWGREMRERSGGRERKDSERWADRPIPEFKGEGKVKGLERRKTDGRESKRERGRV